MPVVNFNMSEPGFTQDDRDTLNSIKLGLYGDEKNGMEGIIHKVSLHAAWIEKADKDKLAEVTAANAAWIAKADKRVATIAGICLGLGLLAKEGIDLISSYFHHIPKP